MYPNVHFTSVFMCFSIRLRKLMFISFQGRILIYQLRATMVCGHVEMQISKKLSD